jgi:hypothetical protein
VTELDLLLAAEEYRRGFYTVGDDSSTDDLAEDDFDEVDD